MKATFVVLAALVCAVICSAKVRDDNPKGQCGNGVNWELSEATGTLTISGSGSMYDLDGSSAPWMSYIDEIKKVVIEDGVKTIGNNVFNTPYGLKASPFTLEVKGVLKNIGTKAFYNSNISDSTTIKLDGEIGESAFENCKSLNYAWFSGSISKVGKNAFSGSGLVVASVPDGVVSVSEEAYYNCRKLKKALIPATVKSIGDNAFSGCSALKLVYYAGVNDLAEEERNIFVGDSFDYVLVTKNYKDYLFYGKETKVAQTDPAAGASNVVVNVFVVIAMLVFVLFAQW